MRHITNTSLRVRLCAADMMLIIASIILVLDAWSRPCAEFFRSVGLTANPLFLGVVYLAGVAGGLYFLANHQGLGQRWERVTTAVLCFILFLQALDKLISALLAL